jgi:hypothetical protein
MKNLYEKLKPEVKLELKKQLRKYPDSTRVIIAELHRWTNYSDLTIRTIKDLCIYASLNEHSWDVYDWKYGEKLFNYE